MPIQRGYSTVNGKRRGYYRYGNSGKKYYYKTNNPISRGMAYAKARKQLIAVKASGG